jgi:D-alanyl-D-alanine-carboxypeptidase/D-alanyl-D-alanine-endopeptidase
MRISSFGVLIPALFSIALAASPAIHWRGFASHELRAQALASDAEILAIIKQRVEEKRAAGIVVGVLEADGRTRIVAFGDPGPGQPLLDGNSVFEIGSISKVFTSTVLADMVKKGEVTLDDPIQKYLPSTVHVPSRNGKQITLGNLSMQNSGLPRMPTNFHPKDQANPYVDYSVQQMYEFVSGYELPRDPGQLFEYSNLGVGLLGHVLTLRAGTSYERLEQERVWSPLEMTHTAITLTPWMKQHLALGHDDRGNVVPNWDIAALAGAGAIRSTTIDMLKFAAANLHPERGTLQQAMAFAHQSRAPAGGGSASIGLNWIIQPTSSDTIVWHNGGTGGYRTFLGLMPARKIAVVVMTNSAGAGSDDIGMHLLNPVLPLAAKPTPPRQHTAIDLAPDILSRYVGVYQLAIGISLDITLEGRMLYVQPAGQAKLRLLAETETNFFVNEADVQFSFVRDAQGAVTGIVLHQGGQDVPGKKTK